MTHLGGAPRPKPSREPPLEVTTTPYPVVQSSRHFAFIADPSKYQRSLPSRESSPGSLIHVKEPSVGVMTACTRMASNTLVLSRYSCLGSRLSSASFAEAGARGQPSSGVETGQENLWSIVPTLDSHSWHRLEVFQLFTKDFLACDHCPPVIAETRYGAHSEVHSPTCFVALLEPLISALAMYEKSMVTEVWEASSAAVLGVPAASSLWLLKGCRLPPLRCSVMLLGINPGRSLPAFAILHLLVERLTAMRIASGESLFTCSSSPRSSTSTVALGMVHPMRPSVARRAATGPDTEFQVFLALLEAALKAAVSCCSGTHLSHQAEAHAWMLAALASKAGSSVPLAASRVRSTRLGFLPAVVGAAAPAISLLAVRRALSAIPVVA